MLRDLRNRFEQGLRQVQVGSDVCDLHRGAREGGKCGRHRTVGRRERHVLRHGDTTGQGSAVDEHGATQRNERLDGRGETDDPRTVIREAGFALVDIRPRGERSLLGTGKADLLHARDERKLPTVELHGKIEALANDADLRQGDDDRNRSGRRGHQQSRHRERRGDVRDLRDVDKRERRVEHRREQDVLQLARDVAHHVHARRQIARLPRGEE